MVEVELTQDQVPFLIKERRKNPCTPEQQAGEGALCKYCSRFAIHQYVGKCTICNRRH